MNFHGNAAMLAAALAAGALAFAASAWAAPPAPDADAPPAPVVDPARRLTGAELVAALRKGGYVLYMRHAQHANATNPCVKSDLAPEGEEQARKVGIAIGALAIPVGATWTSESCRTQDTARGLALGPFRTDKFLAGGDLRVGENAPFKRIATPPARGTNTLLIAHIRPSPIEENRIELAFAEMIVYLPDGKGGAEPVARIRVQDWDALVAASSHARASP
jgi:hypothetical protein